MKKKRDQRVFPVLDKHIKRFAGGWFAPGPLAPIWTDDNYKRPFASPLPSNWKRFTAWLRYYAIQTRWDIERWVARKLHRRWV